MTTQTMTADLVRNPIYAVVARSTGRELCYGLTREDAREKASRHTTRTVIQRVLMTADDIVALQVTGKL